MPTDCVEVYVPEATLKVGVAALEISAPVEN
jgi:hypothetical protein